jgi:hypothetical protein
VNPAGGRHRSTRVVLGFCEANPGQWVRVTDRVHPGLLAPSRLPDPRWNGPGHFESTSRNRYDGQADIYVRFIKDGEA